MPASTFVIEVHVTREEDGRLRTFRRLQGPRDEAVVQLLPNGGMSEGAWAMLVEAARTEALLQLLVKLERVPGFKQELVGAGYEESIVRSLLDTTRTQMQRSLDEALPALVAETVKEIRADLGALGAGLVGS